MEDNRLEQYVEGEREPNRSLATGSDNSRKFPQIAQEVVENFIQNVLFIDDKAFENKQESPNETGSGLDVKEISKAFAGKGISCSFFAPDKQSDVGLVKNLANNADVVVLDWLMPIHNQEEECDKNLEAEVPEGHSRCRFTTDLIKTVVDSNANTTKLFFVYTQELISLDILKSIENCLGCNCQVNEDTYSVCSRNIHIVVRSKRIDYGDDPSRSQTGQEQSQISYQKLPEAIIQEFSKLVLGLLPLFVMKSLTTVRNNVFSLLNVFSKDLDPIYFAHKLQLDYPGDSVVLLNRVFCDLMEELVATNNYDGFDAWAWKWFDFAYPNGIKSDNQNVKRLRVDDIKQILNERKTLRNHFPDVKDKDLYNLFAIDGGDINKALFGFERLTQHCTLLKNFDACFLTLGTVVKEVRSRSAAGDQPSYLLCIQQSCDSEHIKGKRNFLFLKLHPDLDNYEIVVDPNNKFRVDYHAYQIRVKEFKKVDKGRIKSKDHFFEDTKKNKYEIVAQLKESKALQIVNRYCSRLSRVGINEAESIRKAYDDKCGSL